MKLLISFILCCLASSVYAQKINLVKDINPSPLVTNRGSSYPDIMAVMADGTILFRANDGNTHGLWRSDGTNGNTYLIKPVSIHSTTSIFVNGLLYFFGYELGHGIEPWVSDGTAEGTFMLKDVRPGGHSGGKEFSDMIYYNNRVYFRAHDGNNSIVELWSTDGTKQGTTMVKIADEPIHGDDDPHNFKILNGRLLYTAFDFPYGVELWSTDGTPQGTKIVEDLFPGHNSGYATAANRPAFCNTQHNSGIVYKNKLYFQGRRDSLSGFELYCTDGNTISLVKEIHSTPYYGSFPHQFKIVNGTLFFVATDSAHGAELWKTDGTEAGTVMVKDINPGRKASLFSINFFINNTSRVSGDLNLLAELNNKLIFVAQDDVHGFELWESDGTAAGTRLIKDINPGIDNGFEPTLSEGDLTLGLLHIENTYNGILYFAGNDGVNGRELWQTDGTTAGTHMVEQVGVYPDSAAGSKLEYIYVESNNVWLNMSNGKTGNELYLYKATPQSVATTVGTTDIFSIYPNPADGNFTVEISDNSFVNGLLQVYDITGREIYNQSIARNERHVAVGLGDVPAGVYQVKVMLDNRVATQPVSIE